LHDKKIVLAERVGRSWNGDIQKSPYIIND